ncbi:MAG: DUF3515 domain-containing protein [Candidatus Nanopelagicales bacterium]
MHIRLLALIGVAAASATLLAACASPVAVDPPQTSNEVKDVCLTMSRQLPESVADQAKRNVEPLDVRTAAWGDPPIVYRCGVETPEDLTPTSVLASVNGVEWFTQEHTDGFVFTTVKRSVNVQMTVPKAYSPEATALTEISDLIKQSDPVTN